MGNVDTNNVNTNVLIFIIYPFLRMSVSICSIWVSLGIVVIIKRMRFWGDDSMVFRTIEATNCNNDT